MDASRGMTGLAALRQPGFLVARFRQGAALYDSAGRVASLAGELPESPDSGPSRLHGTPELSESRYGADEPAAKFEVSVVDPYNRVLANRQQLDNILCPDRSRHGGSDRRLEVIAPGVMIADSAPQSRSDS